MGRRLRRSGGVALRAGAGAAFLLGVTAAVDSVVALGTAPAPARALSAGSGPAVPDGLTGSGSAILVDDTQARVQGRLIADQAVTTRREVAGARRKAQQAAARTAIEQAAARKAAQATARAAALEARQAAARKAAAAAARQQVVHQQQASRGTARDPRSVARGMLAARGWSGQFGCLDALWQRESGWNPQAYNASSGAFGIPQALPGSKMASAGADWRSNPVTQIRWGLSYIASIYGTPCGAWGHSQAYGWY